MGKGSGDRHLALFAFAIYGLIVFPKSPRYVSVDTVLIGCGGHLWVPLIGAWGAISYSSLMVLSQYGYDQCVPATTSLNNVKASVQDPEFWKKLEEI
ncbi:hypothetical protein Goshw_022398 [Gossypium schwendimanii]|uniref:Uncharacterized protein n=1 Tax=Gossypium schwendimanii TaxID=34291 RepID=A0A7J9NB38_GOSSC|nr:hypothetical protein [Gossypium schwendimanii]